MNQFATSGRDGGGTRQYDLGNVLAARGWDVRIIASDYHLHRRSFNRRRDPADRTVLLERLGELEFAWLWSYPYQRNDWRRLLNWLTFAWQTTRLRHEPRADVVIGSSPQLFAAAAAYALARFHRARFVLEIRDVWPESLHAVTGRKGAVYHLLDGVARFLYRRADRVVVLAEGSAELVNAKGVAADRIVVIPNGTDPTRFTTAESRPASPPLKLLYAGAHGPANGLDVVLEAAQLLRDRTDIQFLLVGDGAEKPALIERSRALGLRNVEFRDPVSKDALPALMAQVHAGLMVLRKADLFSRAVSPNKLFDYFAAGLPAVCNVPGEIAALVESAGGVQAADTDPRSLATAILAFAALDPADRQALGEAARVWVVDRHSTSRLGARLDDALTRLLTDDTSSLAAAARA